MNMRKTPGQGNEIFTPPNFFTLIRILLVPFLLWSYITRANPALTAAFLLISGISDILDGYLARRFGWVSDLGKALDPIADKLTQLSVMICLIVRFPLMLLPLVLLLIKEITSGIAVLFSIQKSGRVENSKWHGKLTSLVLYSTILTHLLCLDIPPLSSTLLITATVFSMLFSFVCYFRDQMRIIRQS